MKAANEYRYQVYVDRKNDGNTELAAWFDDKKNADKEAVFLRRKGYAVEVRYNN